MSAYKRKPPRPVSLQPRELAILRALASDDTNGKAIAEGLGITYFTQCTYRRNLFTKLGVHTAAQAVVAGRAAGYIT